jgi:phosphate transport system protein
MGDLATNIAEDVVYQVEGQIIRHGGVQEQG